MIRENKKPVGEHDRRFNEPLLITIVVVGENMEFRDILIQQRGGGNFTLSKKQREYYALKYCLKFC